MRDVAWLSKITGKPFRLLSEAEREFVTRAGTATPFWWGSSIAPAHANYDGTAAPYTGGGSKGEWRKTTVPVDAFPANAWGLHNVHGNVWEWTGDCWNEKNAGNPGNGSARVVGDCASRVLRGGSWADIPQLLRSANRFKRYPEGRTDDVGFRVARMLTP
jgi:formylglycine-generating enzyme required for sulfatase activity